MVAGGGDGKPASTVVEVVLVEVDAALGRGYTPREAYVQYIRIRFMP